MSLNVELLNQIKAAITKAPKQFFMAHWVSTNGHVRACDAVDLVDKSNPLQYCDTACCIAGWAVAIGGNANRWHSIMRAALSNLGISDLDEDAIDSLFYEQDWPDNFREEFGAAPTDEERAAVACRRIDAFIEHHAAER